MDNAPAGQLHSREEWELMREIFTRLYQIEGKTLQEVRDILARDYGFTANLSASTGSSIPESKSPAGHNALAVVLNIPASPSLEWPLHSPGHLRSMELARSAIQNFFPPGVGLRNLKVSHKSDSWDLGRFYMLAQTISAYIATGRSGIALYCELQDLVDRIIQNKNPVVPTCILQICSRYWQANQIEVLQKLLEYISDRVAREHPLRLLCDALLYSLDFLPYLLVSSSRLTVEVASRQLTPEDPQTLSAQRGLHSALIATRDFSGALEVFTNVMDKEADHEREDINATCMWRLEALIRLICCELSINRLDDAECHLSQLAASLNAIEVVDGTVPWNLRFFYLDFQGELLRLRRDPMAVALLQEAHDLATKNCQSSGWWIVIYAERHLECALLSKLKAHLPPFPLPS
ncbi:hypothetical protein DL95DRAFT_512003 [Leptodontidium sp. 2 PMI_412]|nr:hypothetical protein DL95DRAFT_512003 [Leptodontidium sp. 2 PMI_412]